MHLLFLQMQTFTNLTSPRYLTTVHLEKTLKFDHNEPLNSVTETEGQRLKTFVFGQKFWPLVIQYCRLTPVKISKTHENAKIFNLPEVSPHNQKSFHSVCWWGSRSYWGLTSDTGTSWHHWERLQICYGPNGTFQGRFLRQTYIRVRSSTCWPLM